MIKKYLALASGLALVTPATASIISVDWPGSGSAAASGTAYISGQTLNMGQSHVMTGLNFSLDGSSVITGVQSKNIYTGVYNFNIDSVGTDLLCVELTSRSGNSTYDYKGLNGMAGWLTRQMESVTDVKHGAALALATWEVTYDSAAYNGSSAAGLSLTSGRFQSAVSGDVLTFAQEYLSGFAANTQGVNYVYYRNPVGGGTGDNRQDFIASSPDTAGSVPGPLAVAPFMIGLLSSALKRKRRI